MTLEDVQGLTGSGVPFRLPKNKESIEIVGTAAIEDVALREELGLTEEITEN